jgi:DNA mismatch repair protein MutS2
MNAGALRALELDRIVSVVTGLGVTPTGQERLARMEPMTDVASVMAAQRATTEGTRFLADHPGFPLRAPSDLLAILDALAVEGRGLEPLRLLSLAEYLESIERCRQAVDRIAAGFPILRRIVESVASFKGEVAEVRRVIEPSGEVADRASAALAHIRERLRRQKERRRTALDAFVKGRDAKYLQEQVVTDRNGRYVLMVRAEHRGAIPGILHGGSSSGATLFVEPLDTVEMNNEIVALEELEAEEVRRILLEVTDSFRGRPQDLERSLDVATELDTIQARARFAAMTGSVEPVIAADDTFELKGARHPLLMKAVNERLEDGRADGGVDPVPVDVLLTPPVRVLLITGPNTGGKTVALKTAGLLVAMAQSGLHIPVERGSRLPVFTALFADIGDEQSISASLSTFSAHITNVVAMDRELQRPALVLLDEVGAGTDPVEGGALGTAVIDHFRQRGAHLIATTHYDSLKSYASTTPGVTCAAFGFDAATFAPTYRLVYGSPGRSLAIEIAKRLGMPASVVEAARANLSEREQQLAQHLARVDDELRGLAREREALVEERAGVGRTERELRGREERLQEREAALRRRIEAKVDERARDARREIDGVIEGLKARVAELTEQAKRTSGGAGAPRLVGVSTGETGAVRTHAHAALADVVNRLKSTGDPPQGGADAPGSEAVALTPGTRVTVGGLGLEGRLLEIHGKQAEVEVRGKRLRAPLADLRAIGGGGPSAPPAVRVNVDLQPKEGLLSELNVVGCTVDEAIERVEKFFDEATLTDQSVVRIIHGHGTGQLRRGIAAFLRDHPMVAKFDLAPMNKGGGGVTVVELKG